MKLLRARIEPRWFDYADGVAFAVRPFPTSKSAFSWSGMLDVAETAKRKFVWCLVDWRGIEDADGKPLKCTDELKADIFDYPALYGFPVEAIAFIQDRIEDLRRGIEDQEKNLSGSQSGSAQGPPARTAGLSGVAGAESLSAPDATEAG